MTHATEFLLGTIADRGNESRSTVAAHYSFFLYQQGEVDWGVVNRAIIGRWDERTLRWIKTRAWTIRLTSSAGDTA